LGVSAKELRAAPEITSLLKLADGGLKACLAAMRFSDDPLIRAFFAKYDSLSAHDQKHVPMEAIALSAGIDISHLLGSVLLALVAQSVNTTKVIAVSHHPKITAARVKFGQLPLGERDRTALDTALGFLPSPKGATFIGKAIFGSGQNAMEQQRNDEDGEVIDGDLDLDRIFPPANIMQQKLLAIRQRNLPQPPESRDGKDVN